MNKSIKVLKYFDKVEGAKNVNEDQVSCSQARRQDFGPIRWGTAGSKDFYRPSECCASLMAS
jgi:hypothetical protein